MGEVASKVVAFVVGFAATIAFEAACIFGWEWVYVGHVRPIGPGWVVMPFIGGLGASAFVGEWFGEIGKKRELMRSRHERAQRLGPGWQGNPVKGLKAPPGSQWRIVDTWPPSHNRDIRLQTAQEAQPLPSQSSLLSQEKAETVSDNGHIPHRGA